MIESFQDVKLTIHYIVSFYDSRLGDVVVHWRPPGSFREAVRDAVLRQLEVNGW